MNPSAAIFGMAWAFIVEMLILSFFRLLEQMLWGSSAGGNVPESLFSPYESTI